MHKYDVIWILETYLDSEVQDNDLSISEYDLTRADHSNNVSHNACFVRLKSKIMCVQLLLHINPLATHLMSSVNFN